MTGLDIEEPGALRAYLVATGRIEPGEPVDVEVLRGGVSNRTVKVTRAAGEPLGLRPRDSVLPLADARGSESVPSRDREGAGLAVKPLAAEQAAVQEVGNLDQPATAHRQRRAAGESWVLKQALGKLRVAVDWYSPPERIGREARAIEILGGLLPAGTVPSLVFFDAEQHLLAMSAVPEPHSNWKNELLAGKVEPAHVEQFARILAAIHWGGFEMRERLPAVFADRSVFESLRLEPYYEYTAERAPGAAPFLHALAAETRGIGLTLVHGDYSPKNVLIHRGRMVLLDHEVMHLGDPAFDLGFSLTHLLSKARHLPDSRERLRRAAHLYWRTYCEAIPDAGWAPAIENRVVRHTLGCLMARVAGRSPLEYLTEAERRGQFSAASELSAAPPATVPETIEEFVGRTP